MGLKVYFVIAILLCLFSIFWAFRVKRRNLGFIITTALLIICDILCILILNSHTIRSARNLLYLYYIVYSLMFLSTALTLIHMFYGRMLHIFSYIMAGIVTLQTALAIYTFSAPGMVIIDKHILFGRMWYVAQAQAGSSGFSAFLHYCFVSVLSGAFLIGILLFCTINCYRSFRGKYILLLVTQLILSALVLLTIVRQWPVWIQTMVMNPVCYFTFYFVFLYSDFKLRAKVTTDFANDMSDGLILYNAHNHRILVNDFIKNLIDGEFLDKLSNIEEMDKWISHTEEIESINAVPYASKDETLYFIATKQELRSGHSFAGTVYTLHNTTNSVNRIRLMRKVNRELEETSRMKSDFLANMSHEIRTPMNAVIGMADLALRETNSPKTRDYLNQISRSGKNLLAIINDILDFSKIDAGKMEIIPEEYEPLAEVSDISNILESRVGKKELDFFFDIDPSLPKKLVGDHARIRQILINITNNAIKFTEKGIVKISLTCEKQSAEDVILHFHVLDSGQGIKEDDLKKLFVSFQQLDSKRNRSVEGTGLGLAISKKLCEAMNGNIGVNSEYGKGSDFWFSIPQKVADPTPSLAITDPGGKYAYCLCEKARMTHEFTKELGKFGVRNSIISDLSEYRKISAHDFVFLEEYMFGKAFEDFLAANPEVTGVILIGMGSDFTTDIPNLHIMTKPQTSLNMMLTLNGQSLEDVITTHTEDSGPVFTAPDAKILIVDDTAINLDIAVGLLEPLKIQCRTAESGMQAIEMVKKEHFDVILMDHMMPVMDGIDTTKAIREEVPSAADTPIIALTANVVEGSKEMFRNAGMVDLIPKPIDFRQLNSTLASWLPKDRIILSDGPLDATSSHASTDFFDCLDCKKAIELLGSATLFQKIVEDYYRKSGDMLTSIEIAKTQGDWEEYSRKTHTLKSSSRQIGATELGSMAETLEHAAKASDISVIEKYHQPAVEKYRQLILDLSKYFPEKEQKEEVLPPATKEVLNEIFEGLKTACDELDMDGMEAGSNRLKEYSYNPETASFIKELCDAADKVDGETVLALIEKICEIEK